MGGLVWTSEKAQDAEGAFLQFTKASTNWHSSTFVKLNWKPRKRLPSWLSCRDRGRGRGRYEQRTQSMTAQAEPEAAGRGRAQINVDCWHCELPIPFDNAHQQAIYCKSNQPNSMKAMHCTSRCCNMLQRIHLRFLGAFAMVWGPRVVCIWPSHCDPKVLQK